MKNAELPTKDTTCEEGANWILDVSITELNDKLIDSKTSHMTRFHTNVWPFEILQCMFATLQY